MLSIQERSLEVANESTEAKSDIVRKDVIIWGLKSDLKRLEDLCRCTVLTNMLFHAMSVLLFMHRRQQFFLHRRRENNYVRDEKKFYFPRSDPRLPSSEYKRRQP